MAEISKWNTQQAPYPAELAALIAQCSYRAHEGWSVRLEDDFPRDSVDGEVVGRGLTLVITTRGYDSYNPDRGPTYGVNHFFIVPAATFGRDAWQRWLFDRFVDVETHEAMEFFTIDGERPYAPTHGPGQNPYVVHEYREEVARRTRPGGAVVPR